MSQEETVTLHEMHLPALTTPEVALPTRKIKGRAVTTDMLSSRTCRWPVGDPTHADFHYCGQLPEIGRPYCEAHEGKAFQPNARRRPR